MYIFAYLNFWGLGSWVYKQYYIRSNDSTTGTTETLLLEEATTWRNCMEIQINVSALSLVNNFNKAEDQISHKKTPKQLLSICFKLLELLTFQGVVGCTPTNIPLWEIPKKSSISRGYLCFFIPKNSQG